MSTEIAGAVARILELFRSNKNYNNPRTNELRQAKDKLVRQHGRTGRRVLVRAFLTAAAECFELGKEKEAKRLYNGAHEFATRKGVVREEMFQTCLNRSAQAFKAGRHLAVWRLIELALIYVPKDLERREKDLLAYFSERGINFDQLQPIQPDQCPKMLAHLMKMGAIPQLLPA